MSDARALLRAKRQEARIDHPLATYTSSGVLRCIACGTTVKHATAWEGHIGSKAHRTAAARLREERAREEQRLAAERESLKRKAMEVDEDEDEEQEDEPEQPAKRARVESAEEAHGEPRPAAAAAARSALPADFFSDPSQAPPPAEDEEEGEQTGVVNGAGAADASALDLEWAQFQQTVVNAPDTHETYERATIFAEPVVNLEVPQGFPGAAAEDAEPAQEEEVLDEEALRKRKEQDERELIMDRLMEEEQAQEEADARVSSLKTKLEALKRRREAAKAAKKGAAGS